MGADTTVCSFLPPHLYGGADELLRRRRRVRQAQPQQLLMRCRHPHPRRGNGAHPTSWVLQLKPDSNKHTRRVDAEVCTWT